MSEAVVKHSGMIKYDNVSHKLACVIQHKKTNICLFGAVVSKFRIPGVCLHYNTSEVEKKRYLGFKNFELQKLKI